FARNLRSLLLQAPLKARCVLAIDPGFRTGCKLAALDETGNLLEESVIFPHAPQNKKAEAKYKLAELLKKHRIPIIAIGNGTACRETEEMVSELIAQWPNIPEPPAPPPPAPPPPPPAAAEEKPATEGAAAPSTAAPATATTETAEAITVAPAPPAPS